jgi:hypothetical protein
MIIMPVGTMLVAAMIVLTTATTPVTMTTGKEKKVMIASNHRSASAVVFMTLSDLRPVDRAPVDAHRSA